MHSNNSEDYSLKEKNQSAKHTMNVESRRSCRLTGVLDAVSFDDKEVILETTDGMLTIRGNDIHVSNINLEKGEVDMEGIVDTFVYTEKTSFMKKGESLINRLFG